MTLRPSLYPPHTIFHTLGCLTSFCSVDKEHILTGAHPTPEKVFFLRSKEAGGGGSGSLAREEGEGEGGVVLTTSQQEMASDGGQTQQAFFTSSTSQTHLNVPSAELREALSSSVPKHLDCFQVCSNNTSSSSLAAPFQVLAEVLDLSPYPNTLSCLSFDDPNWRAHLDSLKAIGVCILSTSHLMEGQVLPSGFQEDLKRHLHVTQCACPLGTEVGVTEFTGSRLQNESLLYSFSDVAGRSSTLPRKNSSSLLQEVAHGNAVQPHLLSTVLKDSSSGSYMLMSRGSGEMVATCCSDFWDGQDLQPMTNLERGLVMDFFNNSSLTTDCVALAYNPVLGLQPSLLGKERTLGIFVPRTTLKRNLLDLSMMIGGLPASLADCSADQIFYSMLCNQVFLGVVSLQYQPKRDVVALKETLRTAGIRFVHFTAEKEARAIQFAVKLGLEAGGWNCHISLCDQEKEQSVESDSKENNVDCAVMQMEEEASFSHGSSLVGSVFDVYEAYEHAQLPKGIGSVRPHLEKVDNVPLLVPLFTDCSSDAMREMILILQENKERVMCIGNAWSRDNITIFSQADVSLALTPEGTDAPTCPVHCHSVGSSLNRSGRSAAAEAAVPPWPSPLQFSSCLNSSMCQLFFSREKEVSAFQMIVNSRHLLSCARRGLLFGLLSSLNLSLLFLVASLFFLPPPLSDSHLFWLVLCLLPLLSFSFLSLPTDPAQKEVMPFRERQVCEERQSLLTTFLVLFLPSALVWVLLFAFLLHGFCQLAPNASCHPILGNLNSTQQQQQQPMTWNGWRGDNEQGLLFAQDSLAVFVVAHLLVLSVRFIHPTQPIHRLHRFISWKHVAVTIACLLLQLLYCTVSQVIAHHRVTSPASSSSSTDHTPRANVWHIPWYFWVPALLWPLAYLLGVEEVLKRFERKKAQKTQHHLRLQFETKLGLNSPFQ